MRGEERRQRGRRLLGVVCLTAGASLMTACTAARPTFVSTESAVPVPVARVATALGARGFGTLGELLVDDQGRTLYVDQQERAGALACDDETCLDAWPLLLADTSGAKPTVSGGVRAALVGTQARASGTVLTYAGYPLHVYVGDSKSGDANGQGSGQVWSGITVAGVPARSAS